MQKRVVKTIEMPTLSLGKAFGTVFAMFKKQVFGICVAFAMLVPGLIACVVPADIDERPPADQDIVETEEDGFDYVLKIASAGPSPGRVILPAACPSWSFWVQLQEEVDPDDIARRIGLTARWFLDYTEEDPNIIEDSKASSYHDAVINPSALWEESGQDDERVYVLEVLVSDLGFGSIEDTPRGKKLRESAQTDSRLWVIQITDKIPVDNPDEQCQ